jgi:signal transduction histidine kinase
MNRHSTLILSFILILFSGSSVIGQNCEIQDVLDIAEKYQDENLILKSDSMLEIAAGMINSETATEDVFRYKFYLGHSFMSKWNLAEAEPILEEVLNMAYQMNDSTRTVSALSAMATLNNYKGDVFKAIQLQETAKEMFQGDDSSSYYGLVANLGIGYNTIEQYDKSLSQYLSAKKYYESTEAYKNLALIENNLGELYRERFEDYEIAHTHYSNAAAVNNSIGNNSGLSMNYHNMALNYLNLEKPDSALHYILNAIEIREAMNEEGRVASDYCVLGDIYTSTGEFDKALQQYGRTLTLSEKYSITPGYYYANLGLANLYKAQNEHGRAERFALNAMDVANEMNSPGLLTSIYDWLYQFHKEDKEFEEAVLYLEKFGLLNDSLESARDELFLNATKSKYETDLAKAENQKLSLQQEANVIAQENDRLIKIGLTVLLIVLIGLALIIYSAYKMKARALKELSVLNADLNESHRQVLEQKEELRKLNNLKTNIVSVLGHDLRGPLSNVSGLVHLLRDKSITEDEFIELTSLLDEKTKTGLKSLDMILEWSRLKAGDSNPQVELINPKKQVEEIIAFNKESLAQKSLEVTTKFERNVVVPADPNQFTSIINNLITNAVKFSRNDGTITIGTKDETDHVIFYVKDSGTGFSDDVLKSIESGERPKSSSGSNGEIGTGIGLRIVRDFVEAHHGVVHIKNEVDGAVVSVSFPKKTQFAQAV